MARIASLLGLSVESITADSEGIGLLADLLDLWPKLLDADRRAVLAFAHSRAARRATARTATE